MWLSFVKIVGVVTHTFKLLAHVMLNLRIYINGLFNEKVQQFLIGIIHFKALELEADVLFLFTWVFQLMVPKFQLIKIAAQQINWVNQMVIFNLEIAFLVHYLMIN